MHLQESGEMYLETILVLSKTGKYVRSVDVSEYMGFSKPSVSRAIGLLKTGGYVTMDKSGHLELTDAGRAVAENIYEKHTMLTRFLVSLGVDENTAAEDACKMEHVISDTSFKAIKKYAGMELSRCCLRLFQSTKKLEDLGDLPIGFPAFSHVILSFCSAY